MATRTDRIANQLTLTFSLDGDTLASQSLTRFRFFGCGVHPEPYEILRCAQNDRKGEELTHNETNQNLPQNSTN